MPNGAADAKLRGWPSCAAKLARAPISDVAVRCHHALLVHSRACACLVSAQYGARNPLWSRYLREPIAHPAKKLLKTVG